MRLKSVRRNEIGTALLAVVLTAASPALAQTSPLPPPAPAQSAPVPAETVPAPGASPQASSPAPLAETTPPPAPVVVKTWGETLSQPFYAAGAWVASWADWVEAALKSEKQAFVQTLKNDLAAFEKRIADAGFKVAEVGVSGGLEPEISLTLEVRSLLAPDEEAALRRRIESDFNGGLTGRLERALLLALLDVDEGATAVRPDGYVLSAIEVDVGLIPSFNYVFAPQSGTGDR